jgi:hypothetical protein
VLNKFHERMELDPKEAPRYDRSRLKRTFGSGSDPQSTWFEGLARSIGRRAYCCFCLAALVLSTLQRLDPREMADESG